MSLYSWLLRSVGGQRWFVAIASRLAPRLDRFVYRITRGRRLATPLSVQTIFLTTTGRRSGNSHTVAVSYVKEADDFVVISFNWGKPTTPEWVLNLAANPQAVIEVAGEETRVEAQLVPAADRDALWPACAVMWPAFTTYRGRAKAREKRMYRLAVR